MNLEHKFIFSLGEWIGQGKITFNTSSESVQFYTKWIVSDMQEDCIYCQQRVEKLDAGDPVHNFFHIYEITETGFAIELANEMVGKVRGEGKIGPKHISWEFPRQSIGEGVGDFAGFEVYTLLDSGDYALHAEYFSGNDEYRTHIDGRIWQKSK